MLIWENNQKMIVSLGDPPKKLHIKKKQKQKQKKNKESI